MGVRIWKRPLLPPDENFGFFIPPWRPKNSNLIYPPSSPPLDLACPSMCWSHYTNETTRLNGVFKLCGIRYQRHGDQQRLVEEDIGGDEEERAAGISKLTAMVLAKFSAQQAIVNQMERISINLEEPVRRKRSKSCDDVGRYIPPGLFTERRKY